MSHLVSIVVTTYNSGRFILETLESVKAQTWRNVELIISDDFSLDNTIEISRDWIEINKDRFSRAEIITVKQNTGVSANCNRGIAAAKADWIKFIAGDDVLLPRCIEDNMEFIASRPEAKIVFSQVRVFRDTFDSVNYLRTIPKQFPINIMDPGYTASDQFRLLLVSDRINFTPSYFFKKSTINSVGGYDENNRLVEDYPMWLKLTQKGNRLFFFEKETVGYRQHARALNNIGDTTLFKPLFFELFQVRKRFVFQYLPWYEVLSETYVYHISRVFQRLGINKRIRIFKVLYVFTTIYINPLRYIIYFKNTSVGNPKRRGCAL